MAANRGGRHPAAQRRLRPALPVARSALPVGRAPLPVGLGAALPRGSWLVVSALLAFAVIVLGLPWPALPAYADELYAPPADGVYRIHGHGFGHGRGLSQYGAQGAALQGIGAPAILDHYYPGTTMATVTSGGIRVLIAEDDGVDLQVASVAGLAVRDNRDGATYALPTGPARYRLVNDAAGLHIQSGDGVTWFPWTAPDGRTTMTATATLTAPSLLRLFLPGGVSRTYRGSLTAVRSTGTQLRTVNTLDMEQYLYGVVPLESPASWGAAALQAQAVVARTYAAWSRAHAPAGQAWDICSTTACQVYGGVTRYDAAGAIAVEQASTNDAVNATAGQMRFADGAPAFTQFSSSNGGWSTQGSFAYLPASPDPWDDYPGNPVHNWANSFTAAQVEAAWPQVGHLVQIRITARDGRGEWGGRILNAVLEGTANGAATSVPVTGDDLRFGLGLRSTWWSVDLGAIQAHYYELGGPNSFLGEPTSAEYDVPGGRAQNYQGGVIYWSWATGAHEVHGEILARYLATGGAASVLGLPTTDEVGIAGGRGSSFVGGVVYWSPETGAHEVHGAILSKYLALGGAGSVLGLPTTDEVGIAGGRESTFARGVVYWSPGTGAHEVHGAILSKYLALGGAGSTLGLPTSDEYAVTDGRRSDFQRGSLVWSAKTGQVTQTTA